MISLSSVISSSLETNSKKNLLASYLRPCTFSTNDLRLQSLWISNLWKRSGSTLSSVSLLEAGSYSLKVVCIHAWNKIYNNNYYNYLILGREEVYFRECICFLWTNSVRILSISLNLVGQFPYPVLQSWNVLPDPWTYLQFSYNVYDNEYNIMIGHVMFIPYPLIWLPFFHLCPLVHSWIQKMHILV